LVTLFIIGTNIVQVRRCMFVVHGSHNELSYQAYATGIWHSRVKIMLL